VIMVLHYTERREEHDQHMRRLFSHVPYQDQDTNDGRTVNGNVIPQISEEELRKKLTIKGELESPENAWLLPLVSEFVCPTHIVCKGVTIPQIRLQRSVQRKWKDRHWSKVLGRLSLNVPALVKNFMVILRTICRLRQPVIRIMVRGSRAMTSGGQWTSQLCQYLMRHSAEAVIDLYDPNEIPDVELYTWRSSQARVERFQKNI